MTAQAATRRWTEEGPAIVGSALDVMHKCAEQFAILASTYAADRRAFVATQATIDTLLATVTTLIDRQMVTMQALEELHRYVRDVDESSQLLVGSITDNLERLPRPASHPRALRVIRDEQGRPTEYRALGPDEMTDAEYHERIEKLTRGIDLPEQNGNS